MSLELALAENTAALKALLAHLQSGTLPRQPTPEEVDANIKALNAQEPAADPKPTPAPEQKAAPAPTAPTAEAAATAPTPKAKPQPAPEPAAPADEAPDYATTARAINDLVKARGRQAAVEVLAQFGAETLKAVKPEQFAAVIAACAEVTA